MGQERGRKPAKRNRKSDESAAATFRATPGRRSQDFSARRSTSHRRLRAAVASLWGKRVGADARGSFTDLTGNGDYDAAAFTAKLNGAVGDAGRGVNRHLVAANVTRAGKFS